MTLTTARMVQADLFWLSVVLDKHELDFGQFEIYFKRL